MTAWAQCMAIAPTHLSVWLICAAVDALVTLWARLCMIAICHVCVYQQRQHNRARHSTHDPSIGAWGD